LFGSLVPAIPFGAYASIRCRFDGAAPNSTPGAALGLQSKQPFGIAGGKIDHGDSQQDAARREMLEEIGVRSGPPFFST
jgi:8-oxo-dGTP pyrophosphatase MutT (NUDIX family)